MSPTLTLSLTASARLAPSAAFRRSNSARDGGAVRAELTAAPLPSLLAPPRPPPAAARPTRRPPRAVRAQCDLHHILSSAQPLSAEHIHFFTHQVSGPPAASATRPLPPRATAPGFGRAGRSGCRPLPRAPYPAHAAVRR